MKVIHILKKIEMIDDDIKDLRKMEKSLKKNKSFSTPIYMSIEKQINILLGDKIKLLELKITDPPTDLVLEIEGEVEEDVSKIQPKLEEKKSKPKKAQAKPVPKQDDDEEDIDEITMLTQDLIDQKINKLEQEEKITDYKNDDEALDIDMESDENIINDESIKLLDVALEKGTLNREEIEKEKKKVKFFKDNFPGR